MLRATTNECQVAIVGAGPYGLAAAAHLTRAGVETRVFGEPMETWKRRMPHGMLLRSAPSCSSIGDPERRLTLERYAAAHEPSCPSPVSSDAFVRYGLWFQQNAVPALERRRVARVDRTSRGFTLRLGDGERVRARRLVVAAGIGPFAYRPRQFAGCPGELVSHSSDGRPFAPFRERDVVVIGAGQSALECAALLREQGARVEVVVRAPHIRWLARGDRGGRGLARLDRAVRDLLRPVARPNLDIMGPRFVSWLIAWPHLYRRAPRGFQRHLVAAALRPAGASWLLPRLDGVRISTGQRVYSAECRGSRVRLRFDDGSERWASHVVLGTGFRVDIRRYDFLSVALRQAVAVDGGYPTLGPGFESSIAGLHFVGAPATRTFGPMCHFVVGTRYVARALTRHIVCRATTGARSNGR